MRLTFGRIGTLEIKVPCNDAIIIEAAGVDPVAVDAWRKEGGEVVGAVIDDLEGEAIEINLARSGDVFGEGFIKLLAKTSNGARAEWQDVHEAELMEAKEILKSDVVIFKPVGE